MAIAKPYASAMFALAVEAKAHAALVADFRALADAVLTQASLASALKNPLVARHKKRDILLGIAKGASALTQRAVTVLAMQGRAEQLPQVASALEALLAAHEGTLVADITSARPLTSVAQQQLQAALARATGKKVALRCHENPALLGGVAVRMGSHLLDATLAGALATMKTKLLTVQG